MTCMHKSIKSRTCTFEYKRIKTISKCCGVTSRPRDSSNPYKRESQIKKEIVFVNCFNIKMMINQPNKQRVTRNCEAILERDNDLRDSWISSGCCTISGRRWGKRKYRQIMNCWKLGVSYNTCFRDFQKLVITPSYCKTHVKWSSIDSLISILLTSIK